MLRFDSCRTAGLAILGKVALQDYSLFLATVEILVIPTAALASSDNSASHFETECWFVLPRTKTAEIAFDHSLSPEAVFLFSESRMILEYCSDSSLLKYRMEVAIEATKARFGFDTTTEKEAVSRISGAIDSRIERVEAVLVECTTPMARTKQKANQSELVASITDQTNSSAPSEQQYFAFVPISMTLVHYSLQGQTIGLAAPTAYFSSTA